MPTLNAAAVASGVETISITTSSTSSFKQQTVVPNVPQDYLGASPIIYGTSAFAQLYNPIEAHWPAEACARAIDLGINTFDTSPYYGNSEEVLGNALREIQATHPRGSYYLSTKVGRYGPKKADFDYSKERVRRSVETSMERMGTDYLDVVFAHDVEFVSVDSAVEAVGELFRLKVKERTTLMSRPLPPTVRRDLNPTLFYFIFVLVVIGGRQGQTCRHQWYENEPLARIVPVVWTCIVAPFVSAQL